MGVLIHDMKGELRFSSEMMRQVCMEAQQIREIDQVISENDPFELLSVSLRWMRPSVIGKSLVANLSIRALLVNARPFTKAQMPSEGSCRSS
jgi:hypothetical protein